MAKNIFQKAFSIIELLLALTFFGIISLIAIPYGNRLLEKNRALAYANGLKSALRFTRSSAILLGENVSFCGSKNHIKCDGLWQEGSIVKTDSKKILRVLPKISNRDKLRFGGSLEMNDSVVFLPTGFTDSWQTGGFHYHPKNNPKHETIITVLHTGKVTIKNPK